MIKKVRTKRIFIISKIHQGWELIFRIKSMILFRNFTKTFKNRDVNTDILLYYLFIHCIYFLYNDELNVWKTT